MPIEAMTTSFWITAVSNGKSKLQTVKRTQFPITPAYACTDYQSQGQTIPAAIMDVATPPTGGLNLFNLYVALSRSHGRDTIQLLHNFNDCFFYSKSFIRSWGDDIGQSLHWIRSGNKSDGLEVFIHQIPDTVAQTTVPMFACFALKSITPNRI